MNSIKFLYVITALCITFCVSSSCEKLVDVETPANQITTNQVFESVQTANSALAGLYAGLRDSSPLTGDQAGKLLGSYTDDLDCYATTSLNGAYDIYRNQQIDNNPTIYTYWSNSYQLIYLANSIIEGTEKSGTIAADQKDRIKGEALLVRSLLYYYLQQLFGDIPYVISTDYNINKTLGKTNSDAVLTQLENDLTLSVSLLSDQYRNAERIFPNRKVAQMILAKIYMTQHRWNKAEIILKEIVQSPLYQFQSDITKVFIKSGNHILWQLIPNSTGDPTKEAQAYYFTNAAPTNYALSQNLMNSFSAVDKRKLNWMAPVTVGPNTWYRAEKYKNRTNNTTEYSIIFREDEVYLKLAEALAMQNKIAEALPYVNATRQRAGLALLSTSLAQNNLLNEILLENRREFFTEMGHRFFDLKRSEQLNSLIVVKPNWKDYHRLWPIPQKELLLNDNLNPQNNGY